MTTSDAPREQARRMLQLMPRWHRWAATAIQTSRLGQEMSLRQLGVLYLIREGLTSPGLLARRLWVTPAVVTGLLDRLEQRGFVRREVDPFDRRRVRLVLTASGEAASETLGQVLTDELAAQLATYDADQLVAVGRALDVLNDALAALAARLPAIADPCLSDDDPSGDEMVEPASLDLSAHPRSRAAPVAPRFETIAAGRSEGAAGRGARRRPTRRVLAGVEG